MKATLASKNFFWKYISRTEWEYDEIGILNSRERPQLNKSRFLCWMDVLWNFHNQQLHNNKLNTFTFAEWLSDITATMLKSDLNKKLMYPSICWNNQTPSILTSGTTFPTKGIKFFKLYDLKFTTPLTLFRMEGKKAPLPAFPLNFYKRRN